MRVCLMALVLTAAVAAQVIEGDIVDRNGAPVAGAYITVNGIGSNTPIAVSDSGGHFRVAVPRFGQFGLNVSRTGFLIGIQPVLLRADQPPPSVRIELTPHSVISGKVEDEDGFPVQGARVEALMYRLVNGRRVLRTMTSVESDDLGCFRLSGLRTGLYYLRASPFHTLTQWDPRYVRTYHGGTFEPRDANRIEVTAGEEHSGANLRLIKLEGVSITGRVVVPGSDSDAEWRNVFVYLNRKDEPAPFLRSVSYESRSAAFSVRNVPPGTYVLGARLGNSYPPKPGDLIAEQTMQVADADLRDIVLMPAPIEAVDLTGMVVFDSGAKPQQVSIEIRPETGRGMSVRSGEDGSFVARQLLPGHYRIQVMPVAAPAGTGRRYPQVLSIRMGDRDVITDGFEIDGKPAGPLVITLTSTFATLEGKVLDQTGSPVPWARILLLSERPFRQSIMTAGENGAFKANYIIPGDYRIYLLARGLQADVTDPEYVKAHENDFPPLHAVAGSNPPLVLRIPLPK